MNRRSLSGLSSVALTALMMVVSGCSSSEPPAPPPVQETVFGDAIGTMDRARAVDGVTLQQKQDIDQALEQAEGKGAAAGGQ